MRLTDLGVDADDADDADCTGDMRLDSVDPGRMGGFPTIRDTRVTVGMVLGQLAGGRTIDEVLVEDARTSIGRTCPPRSSTGLQP